MASVTHGNGLVVSAAILLLLFIGRAPLGKVMLGLLIVAGVWSLYLSEYVTKYHRLASVGLPFDSIAAYFFGELGGSLVSIPDLARLAGVFGILCFLALFIALIARRRDPAAGSLLFWLGICIYALGNGMIIAVARGSGGGIGASRHATVPALFWAGLAVCFVIWLQARGLLNRYRMGASIFLATLALGSFLNGASHGRIRRLETKQLDRDRAAISIRMGSPDPKLIKNSVHPLVDRFTRILPIAERVGQYPFNEMFRAGCGLLAKSQFLDPERVRSRTPGIRGSFDGIRVPPSGLAEVSGWLVSTKGAPECIVVVDHKYRVHGAAVYGYSRPDVARKLRILASDKFGWKGYLQAQHPQKEFLAAAKFADDRNFYTLPGPLSVSPPDNSLQRPK